MKNILFGACLFVVAGFLLPSAVKAQSNTQLYPEEAAGLDQTVPDSPSRAVPQNSTEYAISSVLRTEKNGAGVTMAGSSDSKGIVAPAAATDEGFSAPVAYSEYKFAQIQDNRSMGEGFDGPQHNAIVGFDFESYWKTIVGFNFTYTNANLQTGSSVGAGPLSLNSSNSYFFSPYVARNFCDWVNVGGSFTYGRTDTDFQSKSGIPGGDLDMDTTQDTYAVSPFIGIAHTWGAWSFSSTASYIYGYNHFDFSPPAPSFGASAAPSARTVDQTFLWLNNVQYAISSKWSVSAQANVNDLLMAQTLATPGFASTSICHQWMGFGCRANYDFNKDGSVFAAFEHDAFNTHFDDYRIRTGVSYNF